MFTCLLRGRSTPEIRAMVYPCLCLCFEFSQITRTTPLRCTILHLSQIFFTDALTFIVPALFRLKWHRHSGLCSFSFKLWTAGALACARCFRRLLVPVHNAPTRQVVR